MLARSSLLGLKLSFTSACLSLSQCSFRLISGLDLALPASVPGKGSARLRRLRWNRFGLVFVAANQEKCAFATSRGSIIFFLQTDFRLPFFRPRFFVHAFAILAVFVSYRVSQNYPKHVFFHNYQYCAETTEDVDTKNLLNTHQRAKLNAPHLPSPLMTPFSHYFRLALKICFSPLCSSTKQAIIDKGRIPRFHNRAIDFIFAGGPANKVRN